MMPCSSSGLPVLPSGILLCSLVTNAWSLCTSSEGNDPGETQLTRTPRRKVDREISRQLNDARLCSPIVRRIEECIVVLVYPEVRETTPYIEPTLMTLPRCGRI